MVTANKQTVKFIVTKVDKEAIYNNNQKIPYKSIYHIEKKKLDTRSIASGGGGLAGSVLLGIGLVMATCIVFA